MKPGYRTTEFVITVAIIVGAVATAAEGTLPHRYAAIASAIAAAAYAISRGLAKNGTPGA